MTCLRILFATLSFVALSNFFAFSQGIRPYLLVGAGAWRGWVNYDESYANPYAAWQPTAFFRGGLEIGLLPEVAFAPEIGFEGLGMNYQYHLAHDNRFLDASLSLFYTRFDFGMQWHPVSRFSIRPGLAFLISSGAIGSYEIVSYLPNEGPVLTGNFQRNFGSIRNQVTWGPSLALNYLFELKNGSAIGPQINGFLGQVATFKRSLDTPYNPKQVCFGLGLVYNFSRKSLPNVLH